MKKKNRTRIQKEEGTFEPSSFQSVKKYQLRQKDKATEPAQSLCPAKVFACILTYISCRLPLYTEMITVIMSPQPAALHLTAGQ